MRRFFETVIPALALLALTCAYTARAQEAGKRIGEKLDAVGRDVRGGLDRAGQEVKGQFAAARGAVQGMGVEARAYSRLHWDKALNDATIDLAAGADGVVTLKGSVATAQAKARAVELARDTVGVTSVVDQLAVRPREARTTTTPVQP